MNNNEMFFCSRPSSPALSVPCSALSAFSAGPSFGWPSTRLCVPHLAFPLYIFVVVIVVSSTTSSERMEFVVDGAVMMFVSAGTVYRKARQDKLEIGLGHRRTVTSLQARVARASAWRTRAHDRGWC